MINFFDSSCVDRWISRLRPSTAETNLYVLRSWVNWLGTKGFENDPDALVRIQVENGGYEILDLIQKYILELKGRESYLRRTYAALRSFFLHNRAELPRDPSFMIMSDIPKSVGFLSIDDFKKIFHSSNSMYRAIFVCMFQGAMGLGEFDYWNTVDFENTFRQLRKDPDIIRINLPGRKKTRNKDPYYTFIGIDGIRFLKEYLNGRLGGKAIFLNQYGNPVTKRNVQIYWIRHLRWLNLINEDKLNNGDPRGNRYGKNIHELRDLFRTRWQKSGRVAKVAEFLMGHQIDPLGYNKAFNDEIYTAREYKQAQKWINIISEDPEYVLADTLDETISKMQKELIKGYEKRISELEESQREMEDFQREILRTLKLNVEVDKISEK